MQQKTKEKHIREREQQKDTRSVYSMNQEDKKYMPIAASMEGGFTSALRSLENGKVEHLKRSIEDSLLHPDMAFQKRSLPSFSASIQSYREKA